MKQKKMPYPNKVAKETKEIFSIHLDYHPFEPNQWSIQTLEQTALLSPKNKPTLDMVDNDLSTCVSVKQLVVAYHQTWNIKDCLILRKFAPRPGPSAFSYVVSYLIETSYWNNKW